MTSWRDSIDVHPAAKVFDLMPPNELQELANDIEGHGLREQPLIIFDKEKNRRVLIDGRNRMDALEFLGRDATTISSRKRPWPRGKDTEANVVAYIFSVNLKRRHLSLEQKRAAADWLLKNDPTKSDRQIAKVAKVDHKTVATRRRNWKDMGKFPMELLELTSKAGRVRFPHRRPR